MLKLKILAIAIDYVDRRTGMITTPQDYEFSLQSSCNVITHPFCQIYVTWPRLKPQPCSFLRSISALSAVTFRR